MMTSTSLKGLAMLALFLACASTDDAQAGLVIKQHENSPEPKTDTQKDSPLASTFSTTNQSKFGCHRLPNSIGRILFSTVNIALVGGEENCRDQRDISREHK